MKKKIYIFLSILLFKGLPLFGFLIFQFKNAPTPLCLSKNKIKGHFGKNATVTPTKTLPKKQDYSPIIFQITLFTYKLDSFKKKKTLINQILKIKTQGFFFAEKKKLHHTRVARVMRLVFVMKVMSKLLQTGLLTIGLKTPINMTLRLILKKKRKKKKKRPLDYKQDFREKRKEKEEEGIIIDE